MRIPKTITQIRSLRMKWMMVNGLTKRPGTILGAHQMKKNRKKSRKLAVHVEKLSQTYVG